jgi:hypothetical protein
MGFRKAARATGVLWLVAGALATWIALKAATTNYNQCDNLAGTCLRERQVAAIVALQVAAVMLATGSIIVGLMSFRRRLPGPFVVGLVIVLMFVVGYLALDPIHELNHRRTGWLGD